MTKKDWRTHAEVTNNVETSRYPEVIDYCKRLQKASPWIRYQSFGKSPQGRDLPLLIVSREKKFAPADARRTKSAVVLVINGIHPGEIAGKEASLALVRDMAITKEKAELLDKCILLVVPIFSVDGHERMSPYNRINQNGPKEMGWRGTAQNLNLNRDWMKADQPEMQAMLGLYNAWLPDFVMDNHVTDGADYQYDVSGILDDNPRVAPGVRDYMKNDFEPFIQSELAKSGHLYMSYFELKDATDPGAGIMASPLSPRFSDGYGSLQNRPTIVVETHMLKTFGVRISAHYDLLVAALRKFNSDPDTLRKTVRNADKEAIQLGKDYDTDRKVPLLVDLTSKSEPYAFQAIEYSHQHSNISGKTMVQYGANPIEITIPYFHETVAVRSVVPPIGYAIPPEWIAVIEKLQLHGVRLERLKKAVTGEFETYRFTNVSFGSAPYEGRQVARYRTNAVREQRTLPAGSAIVWMNQRCNRVILGLLEPEAPDSLLAWGFMNPIFEAKEYAEDYVLEKLAVEMLDADPQLRQEFEERLKNDSTFAGDPSERLRFFYDRSPYKDNWQDAYPIVRITSKSQIR